MCDSPGDRKGRPEGQLEGCGRAVGLSPGSGPARPASPACLSLSAEDGFITYRKTTAYLKPDLLRVGARQGSCVPQGLSACSYPSRASSWPPARSASLSQRAHRLQAGGGPSGRLSRAKRAAAPCPQATGQPCPPGAWSSLAPSSSGLRCGVAGRALGWGAGCGQQGASSLLGADRPDISEVSSLPPASLVLCKESWPLFSFRLLLSPPSDAVVRGGWRFLVAGEVPTGWETET